MPPPPYNQRDSDSGQFEPKYPPTDFVEVVSEHNPVTTSDVAKEVGCEYRTAYNRLKKLEDDSKVVSEKFGGTLLWSIPDE